MTLLTCIVTANTATTTPTKHTSNFLWEVSTTSDAVNVSRHVEVVDPHQRQSTVGRPLPVESTDHGDVPATHTVSRRTSAVNPASFNRTTSNNGKPEENKLLLFYHPRSVA